MGGWMMQMEVLVLVLVVLGVGMGIGIVAHIGPELGIEIAIKL